MLPRTRGAGQSATGAIAEKSMFSSGTLRSEDVFLAENMAIDHD
jgi:hypothetical protein